MRFKVLLIFSIILIIPFLFSSGWTGTSYIYDHFETGLTDCYCSDLGDSEWTDSDCQVGAGNFTLTTNEKFMDSQSGNITRVGHASRYKVNVYFSHSLLKQKIYTGFYFWFNDTLIIQSGRYWGLQGYANGSAADISGWLIRHVSAEPSHTYIGYYYWNGEEFVLCNEEMEIFEDKVYHLDNYYNSSTNIVMAWVNQTQICTTQQAGILIHHVKYDSLGSTRLPTAYKAPQSAGTIFVDEFRSSDKFVGVYPQIKALKEKLDPINDNEDQQLNATVWDDDGIFGMEGSHLDTVWINISINGGTPTKYIVTTNVSTEYYFDLDSGNYSHDDSISYNWHANDTNGQLAVSKGESFTTDNCLIPSKDINWNITMNCTVSSNFDLGLGNLSLSGGNLTIINHANSTFKNLFIEQAQNFINLTVNNIKQFLNFTK